MIVVVADTAGLLAALDETHPEGEGARWARVGRVVLSEVSADLLDTANAVPTLDRRDFRAIRPLTGHDAFQVLPDDL